MRAFELNLLSLRRNEDEPVGKAPSFSKSGLVLILLFQNCAQFGQTNGVAESPSSASQLSACPVAAVEIAHSANYVEARAETVLIDSTRFPTALCNDGTPAFYSFRPGFGAASKRWLIYLQGGDYCSGQASCSSRASSTPCLVSSAALQSGTQSSALGAGILFGDAADNPNFYDANVVQIGYCSSDLYSGAKAGVGTYSASDPTTWNFQGRAIIAAALQDLMQNHGLAQAGTGDDDDRPGV